MFIIDSVLNKLLFIHLSKAFSCNASLITVVFRLGCLQINKIILLDITIYLSQPLNKAFVVLFSTFCISMTELNIKCLTPHNIYYENNYDRKIIIMDGRYVFQKRLKTLLF